MRLSVVIPAHNEAARLESTLRSYAGVLGDDAELLVVANGCSDGTAAVARRLAREHRSIQVIEIPEAVGKGGAVRAGLARATGTWVGFADADLATAGEELARLVQAATRADGAIASRWARGSTVIGRTPLRTLASRSFALLVRSLFGLPFADTQCGAKIFHRRFLAGYLAEAQVTDLAFDVELLLALSRAGARIEEVPTVWTAVPGSSTLASPLGLLGNGWKMFRSLLRLRMAAGRLVTSPVPR
jgi:glycosyltransferase involved in cell wall biosynthesis